MDAQPELLEIIEDGIATITCAEHQRNAAEQRRHRRHHDRAEAQQTCFADRVDRRKTAVALHLDRETDQHDAVLLDDADQHNGADLSARSLCLMGRSAREVTVTAAPSDLEDRTHC